jgi:hypothetical protein
VFGAGALGLTGCTFDTGGSSVKPTGAAITTAESSAPPSSGSPSAFPSPSASASKSRAPSPVPALGPDQKLVAMTISGGFAGIHHQVILRGDGAVYTVEKGNPVLRRTSAAEFMKLRTLLGDPALDDVPDFTMNMAASDMFQYTLQFDGRTIVTDRSDKQPALDRLIDALSQWLPER